MTPAQGRPSREDVLMDFAVSDDGAIDQRLGAYVHLYPEYAAELTELAEELGSAAWRTEPECAAVDEGKARAALDTFAKIEAGLVPAAPVAAVDPFAAHDARSLKGVAKAFGCNMNFLGRLKDRLVRVEDLTAGFVAALAAALDVGTQTLADFLAGPPKVPAAASFKSDGKPAATAKQSLADALDGSGLTDEQKHHLRSL